MRCGRPRDGARRWASLKSTGCSDGYPDLFFHRRGHGGQIGLAIELKTGAVPLTRTQKAWREALLAEGCDHAVVRSRKEFKRVLALYMNGGGDAGAGGSSPRQVDAAAALRARGHSEASAIVV